MAQHLNVEIKALFPDLDAARRILRDFGARGPTPDHQVDTYFRVPRGRLKLREGRIDQALILYDRPDAPGPRRSDVTLFPTGPEASTLREMLARVLGVVAVVEKDREIWWIENVKVHLDEVTGLGRYLELEAIAQPGMTEASLRDQCVKLMDAFGIAPDRLVASSYVDLLTSMEEAGG